MKKPGDKPRQCQKPRKNPHSGGKYCRRPMLRLTHFRRLEIYSQSDEHGRRAFAFHAAFRFAFFFVSSVSPAYPNDSIDCQDNSRRRRHHACGKNAITPPEHLLLGNKARYFLRINPQSDIRADRHSPAQSNPAPAQSCPHRHNTDPAPHHLRCSG